MEIKEKRSSFLLRYIVGFATLLVVLLLVGFLNFQENTQSSPPPVLTATEINFLEKTATIEEVLSHFKNKTIYLSVNDEAAHQLSTTTRSFFTKLGGEKLAQLALRESYVGVIENGRFVEEKKAKKEAVSITHQGTIVESAGFEAGSYSLVTNKRRTFKELSRGLNLFIKDEDHIIASYTFDFFAEENPLSSGNPIAAAFLDTEKITIHIDKKAYQRLANKRVAALATKVLLSEDADLVPSQVFYQNQQYAAQIRLKGDWTDHLEGEQWSFRVKLQDGDMLNGMRKFSLHHPKTRNYAGEWLFHQLLKAEDILHLNYDFVQVELIIKDGPSEQVKNMGLYALEESFDKQLIERNKRREGIILKIDEAPLWQERADFSTKDIDLSELEYIQLADFTNSNVLPYSEKRIRQDSQLFKQFLTGQQLLSAYLNKELPASEVFDIPLLAKYNAICNLLGANHSLIWHNYRFYYNPITARLEPIGFDANAVVKEWYFHSYQHTQKDAKYLKAYTQALVEVTTDEYIEKLLNWPDLEQQIKLLKQAYPTYQWQGRETLKHNQQILRTNLFPVKSLNIFLQDMDKEYLQVTIENFGRLPVEIIGIENQEGKKLGKAANNTVIFAKDKEAVSFKLDAHFSKQFISKKLKKAHFDSQSDIYKLNIIYKTLGTDQYQQAPIIPWASGQPLPQDLFRVPSTIEDFEFLSIDENEKKIICKQGVWRLKTSLIIPPNYTFWIEAGTRIELTNGASKIISFSPVRLEGTKEEPIEITSPTKRGQGMIVFNCRDTSILNYCNFKELSNPTTENWVVTGAVNFYKAPVNIKNSSFTDNRSEDALNIINTHFVMDNVLFSNTASDAFDGDFVEGTISNALFNDLGNDAIDVSGSSIKVQQTVITRAKDKALSAGESSTIQAQQLVIKESEIALASKDQSNIQLYKSFLRNNKLAFTAFQKKSEFGKASIIADSIKLDNNKLTHLIEKGSSLTLNGQVMPTVNKVKERMYGVEFGASSQ